MYKPFVCSCQKHCFPGPLTNLSLLVQGSPAATLSLSRGHPVPLPWPRVKPPRELPPWAPIPGLRPRSKCLPGQRALHSLRLFLAWSCPNSWDATCSGWSLFPLADETPVGNFLSQSYSSRLGKPREARIPYLVQGRVVDSITRHQSERQAQQSKHMASHLGRAHRPTPTSGHLPWAEARLLRGSLEPLFATEHPRLNTARAQGHRPEPMELFLRIKFKHFHNWSLEVCRVPACLS